MSGSSPGLGSPGLGCLSGESQAFRPTQGLSGEAVVDGEAGGRSSGNAKQSAETVSRHGNVCEGKSGMKSTDDTDKKKSAQQSVNVPQQCLRSGGVAQSSQPLQARQAQHSGAHSVPSKVTQHKPSPGNVNPGSQPLQPQQAQQSTAQRASPTAQRASPTAQRASPTVQTASPAAQRASPTAQRASPTTQRASPTVQRASPTVQTASPAAQRASPTAQRASPTVQTASPTVQRASPTAQTASSTAKSVPPTAQCVAPIAQCVAPTAQCVAPTAQCVAPTAQCAAPTAQCAAPTAQCAAPTAQCVAPTAKSGVEASVAPSTPHKYTRTSLEQKTIKENLQQCVMVGSSQERLSRSKLQQSKEEGGKNSPQSTPGRPSTPSGDPQPSTGDGKADQDFKRPADLKKKGLKSEPVLCLADKMTFLTKRMATLRKTKAKIQGGIDVVYRLKANNPKKQILYDSKLNSLGIELASVSRDIDAVLEELGPVAEVYRDHDRLMAGSSGRTESPSQSDSGEPVQRTLPPSVSPEGGTLQILEDSEEHHQAGADFSAGLPAQGGSGNISLTQQTFTVQETQRSGMVDSQQMDCGNSAAVTGTHGRSCAGVTGVQDRSNTGVTSNDVQDASSDVMCNANVSNPDTGNSEWGHQQSESSENVVMEESVQNNPHDFPPLVDPPPAPQGNAGSSGHVPPRNAWSRGAPSFSTSNTYTGQAFKRRNVVRLKHRGSKEELPDRRFVVRELLCQQMGFVPADILAVINLPDRQGYDVSFKLMSDLDRFWASFSRLRDKEGWRNFIFIPISKPDTANVNIIFWNESVPPQDIVIWLRRHCEMVSDLTKTADSDGIWTGGWRVLVKLRQTNNVTHHLPNSFFIGRERGVCFYAGQPRLCFKCGKSGHVASVCSILKCNLCGEVGHVSSTCERVKCNLCGRLGHFHRDCPEAFHNMAEESVDGELLAAAVHLEEEALINEANLTREEVGPENRETPGPSGSVQQAEEEQPVVQSSPVSVPVSVGNVPAQKRRKKKDKSTRRPESEWTLVQKSAKKAKGAPEVGRVVSTNRYEVLSESDVDSDYLATKGIEEEFKKIEREFADSSEDDRPTKRRPPRGSVSPESDMETCSQLSDSDSDL